MLPLSVLKRLQAGEAIEGIKPALVCPSAAFHGELELLQWARQQNYPWDADTTLAAAYRGHLDVLIWARTNGCDWNSWVYIRAAEYKHYNILTWAFEHGCPGSLEAYHTAIRKNDIEMLGWLCDQGFPLEADLFGYAGRRSSTDMLEVLKQHNCPFAPTAIVSAARQGFFNSVKWFINNGYPANDQLCWEFAFDGCDKMLRWCYEHGCPLDFDQYYDIAKYNNNDNVIQLLTDIRREIVWQQWHDQDRYLYWPPEEVVEDILELL